MTNKTPAESILAELERLGFLSARLKQVGEDCQSDGAFMEYASLQTELRAQLPYLLAACKVMAEALRVISLNINHDRSGHGEPGDCRVCTAGWALSGCAKLLSGSEWK